MKTKSYLILLVVIVCGCVPNMKITYEVKSIEKDHDQRLASIILDVEEFVDARQTIPENNIVFKKGNQHKIDGVNTCINSEHYYWRESVKSQLTQLLVNHLNSRKHFKGVIRDRKDSANYYVTGSLSRFYGQQNFSHAAAVGSQFGIIGVLMSAGTETEGKIIFEITELKINKRNNQVVKDLGSFRREYIGKLPASGDCWCIYANVNEKLNDYYSELVQLLEKEIMSIK